MACGSANEPVDHITRGSAPANSATSPKLPTNVLNGRVIVAPKPLVFNGAVLRNVLQIHRDRHSPLNSWWRFIPLVRSGLIVNLFWLGGRGRQCSGVATDSRLFHRLRYVL